MSSVVSVFKNAGQRSMAKNYHPVSLLSEVSKIFEKLANNRLYHLKKCDLFLILSIALGLLDQLWILRVVSDRIVRDVNRFGAT